MKAACIKIDEAQDIDGEVSQQKIDDDTEDDMSEGTTEETIKDVENQRQLRDRLNLKKPNKWSYPQAHLSTTDPSSYEDAISAPDALMWKKAIEMELNAHKKHGTWYTEEKPVKEEVISCKWIFKKKIIPNEKELYKARLVARGFKQKYGANYMDTYASVVRYESIRVLLAMAAATRWR